MRDSSYVGIDDDIGRECWAGCNVVQWVTVAEHDEMLAVGYIDLDGKILVELESSDD